MIEWANGQEAEYQGAPVKIIGCDCDVASRTVILHPQAGYISVESATLEPKKVSLSGRFRVALMVSYSGNGDAPSMPYHAFATHDGEAASVAALSDFREWLTDWISWNKRVAVATP